MSDDVIEASELSYTYQGTERAAIEALEFGIGRGEIFGLLGPNGAGKSTTQKILIGLLRDYLGDVRVFGKNLPDWGSGYYERIGVAFEFPNHYLKLTGQENLAYFRSLYEGSTQSPADLLRRVDLTAAAAQPTAAP